MNANSSPEQLTVKQTQLITLLLSGVNIAGAARQCRIAETTAHRWLKDELFQEEYKRAKNELFENALDELKMSVGEAIQTLRRHANASDIEPTAQTQIAAAKELLAQAVELGKVQELEARIVELEAYIQEKGHLR